MKRLGQPDRSSLLFDGITTYRELLLLPIVDREPSLWAHPIERVHGIPGALDVPVAGPKPEIAASKGSAMALEVRRLNRDNRSLHTHVPIWRGVCLCAEAESASPL